MFSQKKKRKKEKKVLTPGIFYTKFKTHIGVSDTQKYHLLESSGDSHWFMN